MKSLKILSFVFVIAILLSACGGTTPATTVPATPETIIQVQTQVVEVPATQTVVRLSGWASSPSETALLESLLYQFSVANPDILVKYEPITGDFRQVLLTGIASGTEPDVYYMDIGWWRELAKNDVLLPMDDLMASTGTTKAMFIPSLLDAFTYNGVVYGIPKDFNTLGLFYNKGLFDAAGLAYPTDNWTWTELKAAATALTNMKDTAKPVYGFCTAGDAGRFPAFVIQNGGMVMNADFSDTLLDSTKAIDAAKFYTDFRANGSGVIPGDVGEGWQGTVFGKGQCAMVYEGGWLIPYMRDQFPGVQYGVAHLPAGPAGEGNLIFTVAWGISKNTRVAVAAWKVVEFLTNEASQTTVLQSGFAYPTRVSLASSDYLKNNSNAAAIFNGAYDNAVPFYWGPVGNDVNDQMGKAFERIYLQKMPVTDSFKQAAVAIREKIAQNK